MTCDGESASPPLQSQGAPAGTKSFAISLWHTAPDQEKSYWLIYNIPATANHLVKNDKTTRNVGLNDKKRASYDPMCSKGPGAKTYHISVSACYKYKSDKHKYKSDRYKYKSDRDKYKRRLNKYKYDKRIYKYGTYLYDYGIHICNCDNNKYK